MSEIVNVSAATAQVAVPVYEILSMDEIPRCDGCKLSFVPSPEFCETNCHGWDEVEEAPASPSHDFAWESHMDMLLSGTPLEVA